MFLDDISKLYNTDLGDNIFAAIHEEAMSEFDVLGVYSEQFLGVERMRYFNAGLLVINAVEYRKADVERAFINLMTEHKFRVAQDQDYLNVVCKGRITYLDVGWNKTPIPDMTFDDKDIKVIHYKLNFKPWRYDNVRYQEPFWKYAKETPYYNDLITMRERYSQAEKDRDELAFGNLLKMAHEDTHADYNYLKLIKSSC